MARHSLNRTRHNRIVTKQAGAGAAGWRWPTRPRSPLSPTPPPPGWTRPAASSPWRGAWERRGTIRCPMEGLPSRRRGGEPARLSTVVENLSILDTGRCARLGHRSSRVDLDGDEDDGCGRFLRVPPRAALRRTGRVCRRIERASLSDHVASGLSRTRVPSHRNALRGPWYGLSGKCGAGRRQRCGVTPALDAFPLRWAAVPCCCRDVRRLVRCR